MRALGDEKCPAPGAHAGVNERRSRRFKMVGDDKAGRAGGEAASLQEKKRGASSSVTFLDHLYLNLIDGRDARRVFSVLHLNKLRC